jgi:precorrin-3B synthase
MLPPGDAGGGETCPEKHELNLAAFEIKGWCPGALRPMPSGDGLVVRVRPQLGRLDLPHLVALGEAAQKFGNGQIDLTRRANFQIRGVAESALAPLQDAIRDLGLLDSDAAGESVRNVMVSPLTGIDPAARDVRDVAAALGEQLASDRALWDLPGKFGFVVDGGGSLDLAEQRADIRLVALGSGGFAVGIDRPTGGAWLGAVDGDAAADVAVAVAKAFIEAGKAMHGRMRDLGDEYVAAIRARVTSQLSPLPLHTVRNASADRVGLLDFGADRVVVGIAAPFGRIEPDQICALADAMTPAGVTEVRLSPWRVLYAQVNDVIAGRRVLVAAAATGLVVSQNDPLLRIEACPGAPSCASTNLDTRATAKTLAAHLPVDFTGTVHVSGCTKGCARSAPSELVLVGAGDHYGIVRNGTPRDSLSGEAKLADLAKYPDHIFRCKAHA